LTTETPAATRAPETVADGLEGFLSGADPLPALARAHAAALATAEAGIWIHVCAPSAWADQLTLLRRRLAESADRAALLGRYPLLGVPFAVKDNIDVAGAPTTAACPSFAHVAHASASVVQRLLDAGAVWVGKTNLDQFATGLVGTRSPYGRPASVADPARISGGSSSGSAVAVARGIVPFALGTDTAGSGRVPAGFNGLVGLKPTPGRVGTTGVVPACRTLDTVSIFAHTVADAAHVLALIEGPDAGDAYSAFETGPARLPRLLGGRLRVGVPPLPRLDPGCGYDLAWAAALERARGLGFELIELDFEPLHAVAALLYDGPWVAERHAACLPIFESGDPADMDPTVRQVIARALGLTATETFQAQYRLRALQASTRSIWEQVEVLMVPTAPGHPSFADVDADPIGVNSRLGTYTNFVNLLGWSALAVPAGTTPTGLPFGITFIGRGACDAALVDLGRSWTAPDQPRESYSAPLRSPAVAATLPLAVVGAHLSGLPLNHQLLERGAWLLEETHTAPRYRLYALPGTVPPKPGLLRCPEDGAAIALEVWALPLTAVGSFLALIGSPLGLASIELADGRRVHGFVCEPHALAGAVDITAHGGWRSFRASTLSAGPA
jgi:allophanate hydrolase